MGRPMKFNVNNTVRVRLNDYGRECHRRNFEAMRLPSLTYRPPVEDENGWSTWQLWVLMSEFGPHIIMSRPPFETEIELVVGS